MLNISPVKLEFGAITAIIGENGAGKSTLARCLTGLERKMNAQITIDDQSLNAKDLAKWYFKYSKM